MKRMIKAGLCLMRDGQVLLARSKGDTYFQITGDKIEPGESDTDAVIREVQEELAVTLIGPLEWFMEVWTLHQLGEIAKPAGHSDAQGYCQP